MNIELKLKRVYKVGYRRVITMASVYEVFYSGHSVGVVIERVKDGISDVYVHIDYSERKRGYATEALRILENANKARGDISRICLTPEKGEYEKTVAHIAEKLGYKRSEDGGYFKAL